MPSTDSYRKRADYWKGQAETSREREAAYGRMLTDSNRAYKAAALVVKAQDKQIEEYKAQIQRLVEESRKSKSRNVATLEAENEELRSLLQDMFQKRNGWRDTAMATKWDAESSDRALRDLDDRYHLLLAYAVLATVVAVSLSAYLW